MFVFYIEFAKGFSDMDIKQIFDELGRDDFEIITNAKDVTRYEQKTGRKYVPFIALTTSLSKKLQIGMKIQKVPLIMSRVIKTICYEINNKTHLPRRKLYDLFYIKSVDDTLDMKKVIEIVK